MNRNFTLIVLVREGKSRRVSVHFNEYTWRYEYRINGGKAHDAEDLDSYLAHCKENGWEIVRKERWRDETVS